MYFKSCFSSCIVVLGLLLPQIVDAGGCPVLHENKRYDTDATGSHHENILLVRASQDDCNFGRCSRKSKVAGGGTRSKDWWPCELSLDVLRQNSAEVNPLGSDFDYATEFNKIDVEELRRDVSKLQTTSQSWWPADFGNYGPFFIRLAWHSAGTYRQVDGRGGSGMGQQRFAPLNSWPDNASLDKARRLLWPIKKKYGSKLSWADLYEFAGHVAVENMGLPSHGFGFGRVDTWQADEGIYWGSEREFSPGNKSDSDRYNGSTNIMERANKLESPLADSNMGLIYVDPRGPHGMPDPKASALDIRETFGRMGMNDSETVALIAGGHAFGKTHGAVPKSYIGPEPNAAGLEMMGLGWKNSFGNGSGENAYTSGLEVIWTETPLNWSNKYLHSLFEHEWTLVQSPDGAPQWEALTATANYPDPFVPEKKHRPRMLTSDLALIHDEIYRNISLAYKNDFKSLTKDFALAWYKLLHRDMGPLSRYLGPYVPKYALIWQDPLPMHESQTLSEDDSKQLKAEILSTRSLNVSNLVTTAWGSASSFRISDKRGGANGARIALQPQVSWESNNPTRLKTVLKALNQVRTKFNSKGKRVSLADLIVLGGNAAIEKAAKDGGIDLVVPFTSGRVDAAQNSTDVETFKYLESPADGFRNYGYGNSRSLTEELLVDKASLLTLSPPEMTVLVGGMRSLNANYDGSSYGILTNRPGVLTNDFFTNLLNMSTSWTPMANTNDELFAGKDTATGEVKYTATRSDLIFGSHPELVAISEVYGAQDGHAKLVHDFVRAWAKVMDLDRYDVKRRAQNNVQ